MKFAPKITGGPVTRYEFRPIVAAANEQVLHEAHAATVSGHPLTPAECRERRELLVRSGVIEAFGLEGWRMYRDGEASQARTGSWVVNDATVKAPRGARRRFNAMQKRIGGESTPEG